MVQDHIWAAIVKSFSVHSSTIKNPRDIKKNTKIIDIFPTLNFKDEQANRFGLAILNVLFYLNRKYGKKELVKYKPREEFELFTTVQDVFNYFEEMFCE